MSTELFSLEKVRALKAYFTRLRNSARGKPEYADMATAVRLCEQLAAYMETEQGKVSHGKPA